MDPRLAKAFEIDALKEMVLSAKRTEAKIDKLTEMFEQFADRPVAASACPPKTNRRVSTVETD